ncbi:MAG TPA: S-layer homology domain-containing protein, partial [Mycobacteriales bacterium]|nr:S-layer homology domain-containing protein [Mycobacteriales bacterium]
MSRPLLRRAAVLALSALVLPLVPTASASAQTAATPSVRDVREFACPPGQVRRPGVQPRFRDTAGSTFELEIDCLAGYEVTLGTGDGSTYSPAGTVTRAQMAQFLARVASRAGLPLDTRDAGFTDIGFLPPAARDAINAIANLDVARGRTTTSYAPLDPVRRDQMALFLDRLQNRVQPAFTASRDYFPDDSGGAEASINRVAEAGIVQGTTGGRYEPARALTRQQMAGFLTRYLDIQVQAGKVPAQYVRDNEVLPVAPRETQRVLPGGGVDYSATSLTPGVQYRVLLVETRTLRRATTSPTVLFFADGNGDRVADTGTYTSRISAVNGGAVSAPAAGQPSTALGTPVDGRLTFRVTGGNPDDDVTPLVFPNSGRAPGLELARDLRAVEAFGAGGRLLVSPVDAQPGTAACVNGCLVTAVDRTTSSATVDTDGNGRGDAVFRYVQGTDSFGVRSGSTVTPVPFTEFAARLTRGDTLAVNPYKTGPSGSSTFT